MPITPLHLGPAYFFGKFFEKYIDMIAILAGSVVIDLECLFLIFSGGWTGPEIHGFFHTFIGAIIAGLVLAVFLEIFRKQINRIAPKLKFQKLKSFPTILFSSLIGTVLMHEFIDVFMHDYINPFWPIIGNPFPQISDILIAGGAFILLIFAAYNYLKVKK